MIMLSIDSSTPIASVAVLKDDVILGEALLNTQNTHSEKLLLLVSHLLQELNLSLKEVETIAVAQGPGSFTGLRIGMATAKGLAQAGAKKLIAVPTLDALAYNLLGRQGIICPILNAKKNEVYTALYQSEGETLKRLSDYWAIKPEELANKLHDFAETVCFLGDGVNIYRHILIDSLKESVVFAPAHQTLPRAASIAALAWQRAKQNDFDDLYDCSIIYVRKSEAEVRWEATHGQKITS